MKKIIIIAWLVVALMAVVTLSGCSAFDNSKVTDLAGDVQELSTKIDVVQPIGIEAVNSLAGQGLIDTQIQTDFIRLNGEIDDIQAKVVPVAESLETADFTTVTGTLATIQAANNATSTWNPFSGYINIALGIATTVCGIFAGKNKAKAATATTALTSTVKGVQKYLDLADEPHKTTLKTELAKSQDNSTKTLISTIKQA